MKTKKNQIIKALFISYLTVVICFSIIAWLIIFTAHLVPSLNLNSIFVYFSNLFLYNQILIIIIIAACISVSSLFFLYNTNKLF
jgi:hypothetical protein